MIEEGREATACICNHKYMKCGSGFFLHLCEDKVVVVDACGKVCLEQAHLITEGEVSHGINQKNK